MNKVKILNEENIKKIINFDIAFKANEQAYSQKSKGKGNVWPLVFYEYEHNIFDLDIRSGNLDDSNAYGLKLISYNENNKSLGLEKLNATSIICDSSTGIPLAILNAAPITLYRTGSAAAVGAKYLAREDSENLLVIGSGNVAIYSIAATLKVMNNIKNIDIYNHHGITKDKLDQIKKEIMTLSNIDIDKYSFNVVTDLEESVNHADIIITATPSEKPIIKSEWIKEGTHLSCIGTCIKGHQELDEHIFKIAKSYADDEKQCLDCGEMQTAYSKGIISHATDEIGNVILKKVNGRTNDREITIFDSTGLFLQDLATSVNLLKTANEKNIGIDIDL